MFVEGKSAEAIASQLRTYNQTLHRSFIEGDKEPFL
jgi:hypothetical protein